MLGEIARVVGVSQKAVSLWVRHIGFSNLEQKSSRKKMAQADGERQKKRLIEV